MRLRFFDAALILFLLSLIAWGAEAACKPCFVEACGREFDMVDGPNFDAQCDRANNIKMLSLIAKSPSCNEFLMERMCAFFYYQALYVRETTRCTEPAKPLCPDGNLAPLLL